MIPLAKVRGYRSRILNAIIDAIHEARPLAGPGLRARETPAGTVLELARKPGELQLRVGASTIEGLTQVHEDVVDGETVTSTQAALADALRVVEIPEDDGGGYRICLDADRVWIGNVRLAKVLALARYFEDDGQPRKFDFLSSDGETVISTRFLALDPEDPDASTPSPGDDDYPVPCGHPGNEPGGGSGDEDEEHPGDDGGGGGGGLTDGHPGDTPSPPSSGDCG